MLKSFVTYSMSSGSEGVLDVSRIVSPGLTWTSKQVTSTTWVRLLALIKDKPILLCNYITGQKNLNKVSYLCYEIGMIEIFLHTVS